MGAPRYTIMKQHIFYLYPLKCEEMSVEILRLFCIHRKFWFGLFLRNWRITNSNRIDCKWIEQQKKSVILNSKFRFIARLEMIANEIFFICIFYSCLFNNFKINKNNWIHFTKWEHDINVFISHRVAKKTRMNFTCLFHSQCSTFNFEIMYFWRMARDVFFEWTESHHINELLCFHLNLWREKKARDMNSAVSILWYEVLYSLIKNHLHNYI